MGAATGEVAGFPSGELHRAGDEQRDASGEGNSAGNGGMFHGKMRQREAQRV